MNAVAKVNRHRWGTWICPPTINSFKMHNWQNYLIPFQSRKHKRALPFESFLFFWKRPNNNLVCTLNFAGLHPERGNNLGVSTELLQSLSMVMGSWFHGPHDWYLSWQDLYFAAIEKTRWQFVVRDSMIFKCTVMVATPPTDWFQDILSRNASSTVMSGFVFLFKMLLLMTTGFCLTGLKWQVNRDNVFALSLQFSPMIWCRGSPLARSWPQTSEGQTFSASLRSILSAIFVLVWRQFRTLASLKFRFDLGSQIILVFLDLFVGRRWFWFWCCFYPQVVFRIPEYHGAVCDESLGDFDGIFLSGVEVIRMWVHNQNILVCVSFSSVFFWGGAGHDTVFRLMCQWEKNNKAINHSVGTGAKLSMSILLLESA